MFFIVSLIALALAIAIAAILGLQFHPEAVEEKYSVFVLTVFAFPTIAAVYGGLTLIVCNLISSWLGWARTVATVVAAKTRQGGGDHILVYYRRVVGCLHRSHSVGMVLRATLIRSPDRCPPTVVGVSRGNEKREWATTGIGQRRKRYRCWPVF
jgi:hypothetical protein